MKKRKRNRRRKAEKNIFSFAEPEKMSELPPVKGNVSGYFTREQLWLVYRGKQKKAKKR